LARRPVDRHADRPGQQREGEGIAVGIEGGDLVLVRLVDAADPRRDRGNGGRLEFGQHEEVECLQADAALTVADLEQDRLRGDTKGDTKGDILLF
jgi:hypothetical protein